MFSNHPNQHNDFQPLTDTITAPTGLFSATASGTALGIKNGSKAISDAIKVFTERSFHRDQLLGVLNALIKKGELPDNIPGLNIFGELKESLGETAKVTATGIASAIVLPSVTLTEGLQISVDSVSG